MNKLEKACYLLDKYFDMFERDYYHPAYINSARRQFKKYAMESGKLSEVLTGYIQRQIDMIPRLERYKKR